MVGLLSRLIRVVQDHDTLLPVRPRVPALRLTGVRLPSDDSAGLSAVESWLGKQVGLVISFAETGNASGGWTDSLAATQAQIAALGPLGRSIYWAFPLCHGTAGAGAVETLRGDHDATIKTMFAAIAAARPTDPYIFVRLGWEMNFWSAYPWCRAHLTVAQYIALYRHIVSIGRAVDSRICFDWTPNAYVLGEDGKIVNPTDRYPGDAWVDIVAVDAYLRYEIESTINGLAPLTTINNFWDGEWGINALYAWAQQRGKPFGIAETGINGDGTASNGATGDLYSAHINRLYEFVSSKDVVFHCWWDKSTPFNCRISAGQYPTAASAYRDAFDGIPKAWTPLRQFGRELVEHRDASDVATLSLTGSSVDAWADKVASKVAAATGSARPTYSATARNGLAGVTGDGADDVLVQTDVVNVPAPGEAMSIFLQVYTAPGAAAFSYYLADSDATGGATNTRAIGHNNGNLRLQANNYGYSGGLVRGIDAGIIISWRAAYNIATRAGTVIGSINGGVPWADNVTMSQAPMTLTKRVLFGNGAAGDAVANRVSATLQEVGTICRPLTARERVYLSGYLAAKWGRQTDLPPGHPFKVSPPTYGGSLT